MKTLTNEPIEMTHDQVKDIIDSSVQTAELQLKVDIFPVKHREKYPFDRNLYEAYGHMMLRNRPVASLDKLSVTPSNGLDVYVVPLEWIETANMHRGQINIVPMTAAFIQGGFVPTGSTGGAFFLAILGNRGWIPAYWQAEYTTGWKDGMVPRVINDYVGCLAAIEILSMLAATNARSQSHSLSLDGGSQSVSTPGPGIYKVRMDSLEAKRIGLEKKLKAMFGRKIFVSQV
jgi:hypothetical protein